MKKEELQKKLSDVLQENNLDMKDIIPNEEDILPSENDIIPFDDASEVKEDMVEEELMEEAEEDDYIELSEEENNIELFVGGPTIGELNQWREEFGEIYLSDIGDDTFIWRLLSRGEFKEIANKGAGPYEREEQYCALCTIWPENYDFLSGNGKAGVPSILAEEILTKSGFKPNHVPIQL